MRRHRVGLVPALNPAQGGRFILWRFASWLPIVLIPGVGSAYGAVSDPSPWTGELLWGIVAVLALLVPAAYVFALRSTGGRRPGEARQPPPLVDSLPQAIYWKDRDLCFVGCNRRFFELTGITEAVNGRSHGDLIASRDEACLFEALDRKALETGQPQYGYIEPFTRADGSVRWVETSSAPWFDDDGRVVGVVGCLSEISRRLDARKALQAREQYLHAVVANALDGIMTVSDDGTIQSFNPAAERIFGYSAAEIIGCNLDWLFPEPYASVHSEYLARYREVGDPDLLASPLEVPARHKDGGTVPVELSIAPMVVEQRMSMVAIVHDVSARKAMQDALRDNEWRLRLAQRFAAIGLWDWNLQTGELQWSETMLLLLGYEPGEITIDYESYLAHVHPDDRDAVQKAVDDVLASGERFENEHRVRRADGTERWLLVRGGVIRDSLSVPVRMLGIGQDVTASREVEHELRLARNEAQKADQAKSEFIARMSHELRTPLNAIIGFAEIMLSDDARPLDPEHQENAAEILQAGEHLLSLVDDVLNLSRIDAGRAEIEPAVAPLAVLLEDSRRLVQRQADKRGVRLSLEPANQLQVYVDPTRFKQVMLNLLSNAIKYNHDGGQVTVSAGPEDGHAVISVADTGPGIPVSQQRHLFEPFNRLGRDKGPTEGTGIGLVITRRLVEAMQGTIEVHSQPGAGTRVQLRFPLSTASATPPARSQVAAPPESGRSVHVLHMAEGGRDRRVLQRALEGRRDMTLRTAFGPGGAVDIMRQERVDVLLLDISLDPEGGYGALQWLKAHPDHSGTSVVAISADARDGARNDALRAGFDLYLVKPWRPNELVAAILHLVAEGDEPTP